MTNNILSTSQAARILGINQSTVNRLCRDGELKATKTLHQWVIDGDHLAKFAKTYDRSKLPKRPNTAAINKPVGKGYLTAYQRKRPQWETVQQQIDATLAGKVRPLYLTAAGEVMTR